MVYVKIPISGMLEKINSNVKLGSIALVALKELNLNSEIWYCPKS